jgi:hypothetical protein
VAEARWYDPKSEEPWKPKLENAPFRLCAIVNRMDLCAPELADTVRQIAEDWRRRGWEKRFDQLISRVGISNPLTPVAPNVHSQVTVAALPSRLNPPLPDRVDSSLRRRTRKEIHWQVIG